MVQIKIFFFGTINCSGIKNKITDSNIRKYYVNLNQISKFCYMIKHAIL